MIASLGDWIKELLSEWIDYLKPWVLINQYERGVLLQLGKFKRILNPGFHFKLPIIHYYHSSIVTPNTMKVEAVNITTLDSKTITVGAIVEYRIDDIYKYLIETNEPVSNMHDICRGILSDYLEDIAWDDVKKKTTINAVTRRMGRKLEEMGIKIITVSFTDKCLSRVFKLFNEASIPA